VSNTAWRDIRLFSQEVDVKLLFAKVAVVMNFAGDYRSTGYGETLLDRWMSVTGARSVHFIDQYARTYKKLTDKTLARVRERLVDPANSKDRMEFFLFKDSAGLEIGDYALEMTLGAVPASVGPNRAFAALPVEWADDRPDVIEETFAAWADEFCFQHGTAGYGFNVGFGAEYEQDVRGPMMAAVRRYLGIDARIRLLEMKLLSRLKGPGWLTYLREDLFDQLGGRARLSAREFGGIEHRPLRHGVLLKSGPVPPIGDVNRGATDIKELRAIDRFIRPVRLTEFKGAESYGIDPVQGAAWLSRFEE
jgi:hypothetical protein